MNRYVYYGCTKAKDKNCKCGYINETELIEQFIQLIDKVDLDETSIRQKLKTDIERIKKFNKSLLGKDTEKVVIDDIDIKTYAKYTLKDGLDAEKRELLLCLKSRIIVKNKTLFLL